MSRMGSRGRVGTLAGAMVAAVGLWAGCGAGSVFADGTCGSHDSTGRTACPIVGSASTYQGSLTPAYDPYPFYGEHDYYVFHARAGTALIITLHDDEDPACASTELVLCGQVEAELDTRSGEPVTDSKGGEAGTATVNSAGVPVATTLSDTIRATGTYYLVVRGALGRDLSVDAPQTELTVPYSFEVSAHPGISWPPTCSVPRVRRHMNLLRGELAIRHAGCAVGRIRSVYDPRVPAGDVVGFRPRGGRSVPLHTRVEVILSTHRERR